MVDKVDRWGPSVSVTYPAYYLLIHPQIICETHWREAEHLWALRAL
jgi:hypothetical protein